MRCSFNPQDLWLDSMQRRLGRHLCHRSTPTPTSVQSDWECLRRYHPPILVYIKPGLLHAGASRSISLDVSLLEKKKKKRAPTIAGSSSLRR